MITIIKLFITSLIWGRKLTITEISLLRSLNRKLENVIVLTNGDPVTFNGTGLTIGSLTFIEGGCRLCRKTISGYHNDF